MMNFLFIDTEQIDLETAKTIHEELYPKLGGNLMTFPSFISMEEYLKAWKSFMEEKENGADS